MIKIIQVSTEDDKAHTRDMFKEYLVWVIGQFVEEYDIHFDVESVLEEDMKTIEKFSPPFGRLLLAFENDQIIGVGCLKKLKTDICEIKRVYVKPDGRRKGIGKALIKRLLLEASEIGYKEIWLDSAKFMEAAHKLYKSFGFKDTDPYPESEVSLEFQENVLYMKLVL